ncbi:MAG: dNTP triphosphohydrolase [Candidatus Methanosuratincola sp.]
MRNIATPIEGKYIHREHEQHFDPTDKRTPFQHDRDRIIHSTALKSLQYKTQVYMIHEGDLYRTRLTHTLEVAQISRSLAIQLDANVDLAEAIALAHDLGHTPFGHAGETAMEELLSAHRLRFNHNVQGYKVATCLEERSPDFKGLNLTYATLEGILRHNTIFDNQEDIRNSIPRNIWQDVKKFWETNQAGVEAQIASLADIVAYASHDIEDALLVGLISWAAFKEEIHSAQVTFLEGLIAELEQTMEDYSRRNRHIPDATIQKLKSHQLSRKIINKLIIAIVEQTNDNIRKLKTRDTTPLWEAVREAKQPVVAFPPNLETEVHTLVGEILLSRVYRHHRVVLMEEKARRIISLLFETFMTEPQTLPESVQYRLQQAGDRFVEQKTNKRKRAEIVADYIASMTDKYAMDMYQLLVEAYEKVL